MRFTLKHTPLLFRSEMDTVLQHRVGVDSESFHPLNSPPVSWPWYGSGALLLPDASSTVAR